MVRSAAGLATASLLAGLLAVVPAAASPSSGRGAPPPASARPGPPQPTRIGNRAVHPDPASLHDKGKVNPSAQPSRTRPGHVGPAILPGTGSGYSPQDLESAYDLPSAQLGSGRVMGIVDAYDNPDAESDLATYRSNYNLSPCTTANGCFRKLAQNGSTSYPQPAPPSTNWAPEIALDLDMVSAACPNCQIVLVEANTDTTSDLVGAINEAVSLGVNAVSMSWSTPEYASETSNDSAFSATGVAFLAAAGDGGYGTTQWPAASNKVFAVGGTDLEQSGHSWYETAWSGTTSGCSLYEAKPSFQHDGGCGTRTIADVSADADSSVSVYSSYPANGFPVGWQADGGTSASTPLVAGTLLLPVDDTVATGGPSGWYQSAYQPGAFSVNDITSGSDGPCGSYLCNAGPGYDGPTGLGSPAGPPPARTNRLPSETRGGHNKGEADPPACTKGDPVVCVTGDLAESATDLSVPGRGRALDLTRAYSAQGAVGASSAGALGWGWTDTYAMSLAVDSTTGDVTITQEDGATVTFNPQGSSYVAPGWVLATLTKNADGTYTYTLADQSSDTFSSSGQLTSESDRLGYVTSLAYNASGQLASVTEPAGRQLSFAYNATGELAKASDPAGRSVSYAYDGSGNLASVTDPAGGVTSYGYDSAHRLTTMTNAAGGVTNNAYDGSNRVTSQADPMGRVTSFSYSTNPDGTTTTTIADPAGNQTVERFNSYLQLISITKGQGSSAAATSAYTYVANNGELANATDPDSNTTSFTWDAQGNRLSATDPLGNTTTSTYDPQNDLTSVTDPLQVTTTNTYDAKGELTSVSTPLYGPGSYSATTTYGYDPGRPGDITSVTDPNGNTSSYGYDADGDRTSATDPLGDRTTYAHDQLGRPTSSTSPLGYTTTYTYDALGRLTSTTNPLGDVTRASFDALGDQVSTTDAAGNVTNYRYDADQEITGVTRADATTLAYGYDADGNQASQTNGGGQATTYGYDPLDRLTSVTYSVGDSTSYTYDGAGNRTSQTDSSGTIDYSYTADNQLSSSQEYFSAFATTYSYDADGQRVSMNDASGQTTYYWDALHQLTSDTDGAGKTVSYNYDLAGNLTGLGYPSGQSVTRGYDAANRLTSVMDWLGNTTSFAYDSDSNLSHEGYGDGTSANLGYDEADHVNSIVMSGPTAFAPFGYYRNQLGLVSSADEQLPAPGLGSSPQGVTNTSTGYTYTPLDQTSQAGSSSYAYDAADNLVIDAGSDMTYNRDGQIQTRTQPVAGRQAPTTYYSYDGAGDRTGQSSAPPTATTGPALSSAVGLAEYAASVNYQYDVYGNLSSYGTGDSSAVSYSYNGDGLRMTKTLAPVNDLQKSETTTFAFAWDLSEPLPLVLSDGTNSYLYGPDDLPIEQITPSGTVAYLHQDQLGSTRLLTSQGKVVATYTYDPYGKPTSSVGSVTTPLGFAGQYTDAESGLIYMRARYYDPTTGEFLTRDPAVQLTQEPYSYSSNDPLNSVDPSGLNDCGLFSSICDVGHFLSNCSQARGGLLSGALGCDTGGTSLTTCGGSLVSGALGPNSTAAEARAAAEGAGFRIPQDFVPERVRNNKGFTFRPPASEGDQNTIRVMEPTPEYPDGYVRVYNQYGQPVDLNGKPLGDNETHFPLPPDETFLDG